MNRTKVHAGGLHGDGSAIAFLLFIPLASQMVLCQQPAKNSSPDGKAIFEQNCAKCHGTEGQGVNAVISMAGPSLQAVHDRQRVIEMVTHGKGVMPTFSRLLTPQQINAVADYVAQHLAVISLKGGDLAEGGMLFRENCAACHRSEARGGALAFAGTNAPAIVDDMPSTIAGAIRSGPGPMPAFPPSVINDQQLASIVAYVKFLQRPPSPGGMAMHYYGPVAEGLFAWIVLFILIATTGLIEKGGKG
jgi:ubiquinol-cytochrome c reductase cytochrome c subunit